MKTSKRQKQRAELTNRTSVIMKNGFASSRQKYDKRISEIFRGRYQTAEIHLSVLKTGYAFRRNTKSAGRSN